MRKVLAKLASISVLAGVLAVGLSGASSAIEIGMNYSWWRFNAAALGDCLSKHPAHVLMGGGIVAQYQDSAVRKTVVSQLHGMHDAGFNNLKIHIKTRMTESDGLEMTSSDGSLSPQQSANVTAFIRDIDAAGFSNLEVSIGVMPEDRHACRRVQYCTSADVIDRSWRFISQVTDAVRASNTRMPLRYDLSSEGCPSRSFDAAKQASIRTFLTTIVGRFQAKYGDQWLVSCPSSPAADRVDPMLEDLQSVGLKPKYLEIHSYKIDPQFLTVQLDAAEDKAERIGAKLILGEMRYHSDEENKIIIDWVRQRRPSQLIDLIQWPVHDPATKCPMDTPPPYTPGGIVAVNNAP